MANVVDTQVIDEMLAEVESAQASKPKRDDEKYFESADKTYIRTTPQDKGHWFRVPTEAIRKPKKGGYLLIGFDTEYQPLQERFTAQDVKDKKARYEVLSYQFHAINDDGAEWDGISIPQSHQRMKFTDFLVHALSTGVANGNTLPDTIVLVGHYNRADIPAFDDRDQLYKRVQNIRNSLVTPIVPLNIKMTNADSGEVVDLKVYLRDTMLLAPAGKKSLAGLGELIGIPKIKLAETREDDLQIKKAMKAYRALNWDGFREYAMADAKICARYFKAVADQYANATGSSSIPSALSSIGVKLLINDWDSRGLEPNAAIGKEVHREEVWNDKVKAFRSKKFTTFVEELHWHVDFATECYHGGRNEQFWFGPSYEDAWTDYDLTSAYPVAMATIGKPDWKAVRPSGDIQDFQAGVFGFTCVDFRFPENTRYPVLPVRTANGIVFPLSGRSYCATPELLLAQRLGCELKLRHGIIIPIEGDDLFFPFIKDSIRRRREGRNDVEKAFWKEVTNSCYGKTAQGLRERRVFSLRTKKSEKLSPSKITNPFIAAYITSFVRGVVGEIMNAIPDNKMVFSVTTDGFITNATEQEIDAAKAGPLARQYGATVLKLTGVESILAEKHSYEQNDWIVQSFFDRTPGSEFDMDVHTTLREMLLYDADLVNKSTPKRISMEYDFKRRPYAVAEVDVVLPSGENVRHVAFSTSPLRDVAEFKMIRTLWDDYRKGAQLCIKAISDFREFAEFSDMMTSLPLDARKFIRHSDTSGLQRLRRDLCRAFKSRQAGFARFPAMTEQQFADLLNDCGMRMGGVEVSIDDIGNGKRAKFVPGTSPPTVECLRVLNELTRRFPHFEKHELIGSIGPDQMALGDALARYLTP